MFARVILIGSIALSALGAGGANASAPPVTPAAQVPVLHGLRVAQDSGLPQLSPSAQRRLTFYSDRAILALFDLANEDLAAGQGGAEVSDATLDALRDAIEKLIDAGKKADLTLEQTAAFFAAEVRVRFSGPLPLIVQGMDGGLDATALFKSIENSRQAPKTTAIDSDLLGALNAESAQMVDSLSVASQGRGGGAAPVAPTGGGVQEEEVDPAVRAILDRVEIVNGQRTIQVIRGDTLATYAAAFYGDPLRYRAIFLANPGVVSNPNTLEVGAVLVIPEE